MFRMSHTCYKDEPVRYACAECARKLGAYWPRGHYGSWKAGQCSICREYKGVCASNDWKWKINEDKKNFVHQRKGNV